MTDVAPEVADEETPVAEAEAIAAESTPAAAEPAGAEAPAETPGAIDVQAAALAQVKGRIQIEDEVVEKVAALAAIEVEGVADLGGDIERAVESVRERIGVGNKRGDQGVTAEIRGREVSITIQVVLEYGSVAMDVAREVKTNVARSTNRMLGLRVVEVNVVVDDVVMPDKFNHGTRQHERELAREQEREQRRTDKAREDENRYVSID